MLQYDEFRAMNTAVLLSAEGTLEEVVSGFAQARNFIEASEQRFSRFRADSELSGLNRSSGVWVKVSEDLFDLLWAARDLYDLTGGLFDPTTLTALRSAGYDRSMDEVRLSGPGAPQPFSTGPAFDELILNPEDRRVFMPDGMQIDLGGVAKGWIASRAASILSRFSPACAVSAGGDMALLGIPSGQSGWEIALDDPRNPGATLGVFTVGPCAIATSSVAKRSWIQNGRPRHHIIDPRTGLPARPTWLSVTAIHADAATSEAFAKALLIAGLPDAEPMAARAGNLAYYGVRPDGSLHIAHHGMEVQYVDATTY